MGGQPLAGRSIVVTRPAGQADSLCAALTALGAEPLCFPLLTIAPVADPAPLQAMARRLADFSLAFFVSPNAVRFALDAMLPVAPWPAGVQVATVGKGSEAALAERGFTRVIAPSIGFDSEAVLALPAFQADAVAGRRVLCCAATAAAICWATPSPPAAPGSNTSAVTTVAAPPTTRRFSSTVPAPAASTPSR
jgi:uroporphyrinogen-III synthase